MERDRAKAQQPESRGGIACQSADNQSNRIEATDMKRVVIVGGGFAGINCAKALGNQPDLKVALIDRRNYHLFQPLLYQVAMAGLSPCDIATPIRGLMSRYANVHVIHGEVSRIDVDSRQVHSDAGVYGYDYLVLATGAQHTYFGQEHWEEHAPGLKTLEQATEIRRRVLSAFESAECEPDANRRRALMTFIVVGGGPTGVELAGAIGEMSRFTLARDFRNIDPKLTRIVLVEAGPRILPSFDPELASKATRELEQLGVQLWTNSRVTRITPQGVYVGEEHLTASTVLWAAGVQASPLGRDLHVPRDPQGRVVVGPDLSIPGQSDVFVAGDQAHSKPEGSERALPGVATVALQQGQHVAASILADLSGTPRVPFAFRDKGQMAAIGRRRAVMQRGRWRSAGVFAWLMWLLVHIYFLSGFKNRLFVLMKWGWSYLTFARGSRLIVSRDWRSYTDPVPELEREDVGVSMPVLVGSGAGREMDDELRTRRPPPRVERVAQAR
jgi:NADH:ubiquinone reductase (H+-translocating)